MPGALFDLTTVARNRVRARGCRDSAMFLQNRAIHQVSERLSEINKSFTSVAVVTPFAELWQAALPGAVMIQPDETLELAEQSFDLIVHALNLHWSNDPVGQLIQCRRALRPDGLLLAVLFGGQSLSELRASLAEAESQLTGGLSPRVSPMAEMRDLGGLLGRAGLALTVADCDTVSVTYETFFALLADLRAMGETNALTTRRKNFTARGLFDLAAELYAANFATKGNRLAATADMIYLTGWAPSATQPQPLRPGSAKTRLADALGVEEMQAEGAVYPSPKDRAPK